MAFVPDQPYPKTPGNPIMAKDWNDAITEVQRLDTAKVNRTGADNLQGPLTIANALAVGSTQAAGARLHVVDSANPAVARIQSTAANASARLELYSDPRGSGTEWRPGYIESFDNAPGTYTGGLRFFTNGSGLASRFGFQEQLRLVNGLAGFGLTDPAYRIDTNGQIRIRQGSTSASGLFLHQATPNANRVFLGMMNDNVMGIQAIPAGNVWGLQVDATNANVGIKTAATAVNTLTVGGNSQVNGDIYNTGNMAVGHNAPGFRLDVNGRIRLRDGGGSAGLWLYNTGSSPLDRSFIGLVDQNTLGFWGAAGANWGMTMDLTNGVTTAARLHSSNVKLQALVSSYTSTTSGTYGLISGMTLTFYLPVAATCLFHLVLPGCDLEGVTGNWGNGIRLMLDGAQVAQQTNYFSATAGVFETRHIVLSHVRSVAAGTHTLNAEWYTQGGTFYCSNGGADRVLQVIELA